MTKPLLIWQPDIFPDEEKQIAAKYFCVQDFDLNTKSHLDNTNSPFAMRGAVYTAGRLGHNLERFNCQKFVPHLHEHMISRNFGWTTPEVISKWEDEFFPFFIRPDSCKKLFAGQVYPSKEKWLEEFNYLKQKNGEKILAFVAEPEKIGYEWRCLFVGQHCVGISAYMLNGEILDPPLKYFNPDDNLILFAHNIRKNDYFWEEDNLTIDIGQREDGSYGLVEINFLETAGWYSVDKDLVYAKLAKQFI